MYATITDFHEQRNGRQVLSRSGKVGLGILLVSTVVAVTIDGWELNENQASAKVSDKLQGIADGLEKTGKTLEQTGTKLDKTNEKLT